MISILIRTFSLVCDQMSSLIMCGHLLLVEMRTYTPHTYTFVAQYTARSKHYILSLYWRTLEFVHIFTFCVVLWPDAG